MPEYVERETLLKHAIALNNPHELGENVVPVSDIEAAPATDVAPVVHCCQCKHDGECAIKLMIVSENGNNPYCSLGKRRGEDNV